MLGEVPFFPGARTLVLELASELPLGIASGALRREIEAILQASGLRDAFAAVVGADDVSRGKPDPEPYLKALARLRARAPQLGPADCLVFEDSVPGILAARAAGMKVIGVASSYPAARLQPAHRVVPTLAGLDLAGLREMFPA
jgi:HAD superfamily hydrolase (TIGR01509 family)